jgi:hypothetical protein
VLVLTIAGLLAQLAFVGMVLLGDLRQNTLPFLGLYGLAGLAYAGAVIWLRRRPEKGRVLPLIVGLAVVFRLTLLFTTPPTLSDDVYRYIWDGRMSSVGVSPYAHAVSSPELDPYDSPQRALVNHDWMASPYLPMAQAQFAAVYWLAPDSPLAFQVVAILFDLLTGCLVIDLLRRLGLPKTWVLIYLWNPLVVVEFAHGAHVDALMVCLTVAALWLLVAARSRFWSAIALAAGTLTKGLPLLLLLVVGSRWRWRDALVYAGVILGACLPFALGAGWGLTGPISGEGLFGALRIYSTHWNYNGGLYRLLENGLAGRWTPGAVSPEVVGSGVIWVAKGIAGGLLVLALIAVWRNARRCDDDLSLLRLALLPLAAYLLLTTTVHPWYVTLIVPLFPFLLSKDETVRPARFLVPGVYFSIAVALSYWTYVDPANPREYWLILLLEYLPAYLLLLWAAWPASGGAGKSGRN